MAFDWEASATEFELRMAQDMYRIVKRRARNMLSGDLSRRACRIAAAIAARVERRREAREMRRAA